MARKPFDKDPGMVEIPTSLVTKLLEAKQRLVDEAYDYDRKTRTYGISTTVIREVLAQLQQLVVEVEFKSK